MKNKIMRFGVILGFLILFSSLMDAWSLNVSDNNSFVLVGLVFADSSYSAEKAILSARQTMDSMKLNGYILTAEADRWFVLAEEEFSSGDYYSAEYLANESKANALVTEELARRACSEISKARLLIDPEKKRGPEVTIARCSIVNVTKPANIIDFLDSTKNDQNYMDLAELYLSHAEWSFKEGDYLASESFIKEGSLNAIQKYEEAQTIQIVLDLVLLFLVFPITLSLLVGLTIPKHLDVMLIKFKERLYSKYDPRRNHEIRENILKPFKIGILRLDQFFEKKIPDRVSRNILKLAFFIIFFEIFVSLLIIAALTTVLFIILLVIFIIIIIVILLFSGRGGGGGFGGGGGGGSYGGSSSNHEKPATPAQKLIRDSKAIHGYKQEVVLPTIKIPIGSGTSLKREGEELVEYKNGFIISELTKRKYKIEGDKLIEYREKDNVSLPTGKEIELKGDELVESRRNLFFSHPTGRKFKVEGDRIIEVKENFMSSMPTGRGYIAEKKKKEENGEKV